MLSKAMTLLFLLHTSNCATSNNYVSDASTIADAATDSADGCSYGRERFPEGGCGDCQFTSCCADLSGCDREPDCKPLFACEAACSVNPNPPPTCTDDCKAAHPKGQAAVDKGAACTVSKCRPPC